MLKWMKLSHVSHSGRLRPHEHTSYIPLGVLLLVVGLSLIVYTATATSPGPESSSIGLTGTVPGKAPTVAATITSPNSQQHFLSHLSHLVVPARQVRWLRFLKMIYLLDQLSAVTLAHFQLMSIFFLAKTILSLESMTP